MKRIRSAEINRLREEILTGPPAAALPANLTDRSLDIALIAVEQVINFPKNCSHEMLLLPLSLVLHILGIVDEEIRFSELQLFQYLQTYREELAMEKLRRWGVHLMPAATVTSMFAEQ